MTTNVIMPQMGESITEGTITTWYKQVGDWVEKDDSLLLISTDKVDAEVPSPASGFLQKVLFPEGRTVEIDTVIAVLSADQGASGEPTATPAEKQSKTTEERSVSSIKVDRDPQPAVPSFDGSVEELRKVRSSPLVRKMAQEHNLELTQIRGTGISGRVTKRDLLAYLERKPAATSSVATELSAKPVSSKYHYRPTAQDRLEPFSSMRSQIADHMVFSRETSVHVTTVFEVDMTHVAKLRAKHKSAYQAKGVKLSFMPFILKAVTDGVAKFPIMNSAVVERSIAYRSEVNIGMAVAVDWGLLVPVIRDADGKSVLGLSKAVNDLAERARDRKITPDELQGGTFTVTNPGVFGSLFGTPIINQPQVAILCVGTITKRPVVIDDDAIAVRQMMYLALSFDHRIIDGATADRFMKTVKERLENFSEDLL